MKELPCFSSQSVSRGWHRGTEQQFYSCKYIHIMEDLVCCLVWRYCDWFKSCLQCFLFKKWKWQYFQTSSKLNFLEKICLKANWWDFLIFFFFFHLRDNLEASEQCNGSWRYCTNGSHCCRAPRTNTLALFLHTWIIPIFGFTQTLKIN